MSWSENLIYIVCSITNWFINIYSDSFHTRFFVPSIGIRATIIYVIWFLFVQKVFESTFCFNSFHAVWNWKNSFRYKIVIIFCFWIVESSDFLKFLNHFRLSFLKFLLLIQKSRKTSYVHQWRTSISIQWLLFLISLGHQPKFLC